MIPVFVILNVILAWIDATRINKNKFIDHFYNAFIYSCFVGLAYYVRQDFLLVLGLYLLRIPVFNTSLNVFRGLSPTYISSSPASVVDKIINPIISFIGYWIFNIIILLTSFFLILFNVYKPEQL
jgi:hypothetical protein